ncbi:uncharacterized protein LOC143213007 isoform X3 [Lasioglossum baleicum]|uniref:uncharacterized protein LOC143213007 isoform X3 n=1 Tax=Lasioglossum baleicum TaxID=434251 RepID=UPI003FCDFF81
MAKGFVVVCAVLLAIVLVGAKPLPQSDINDSETLQSADTLHNGYAFWFGRPYYEMDDDAGYNGGFDSLVKQRTSTMSYANVGGGWGR